MPGPRAPEETRREQILHAAFEVALRAGIDALTLRAVAAEAGLSHGLVVFYFNSRDELIAAVLDRVLATTAILHVSNDVARLPPAPARLIALLRQELDRFFDDPRRIRLFFEYWALGVRDAATREKIRAAMKRYREAFRAVATELLPRPSRRRRHAITADSLAALAVAMINGCAVQAMIDPDRFDTEAYLAAVQRLLEPLGSSRTTR